MGFLNASSLKKHKWQVRKLLTNDNFYHVFSVFETRLGHEVSDNVINVPGYSTVRQDRNTHGGGILLFIKENFKAKILCSSRIEQTGKPLKPEYLFCSVWEGNSTPDLITLVYRPPDVNIRSDPNFIDLLRTYCSDYSHKVILGDWNANMLNANNSDTKFVNNLITDVYRCTGRMVIRVKVTLIKVIK